MADLDSYGREHGITMTTFEGYNQLTKYLYDMKDAYGEAKILLDDYANAEARVAEFGLDRYREMLNLPKDADVETLRDYAREWDKLINSIEDSAYNGYGKRVRASLLNMLQKDFPQIYKEWLRITEYAGSDGL